MAATTTLLLLLLRCCCCYDAAATVRMYCQPVLAARCQVQPLQAAGQQVLADGQLVQPQDQQGGA